MEQGPANGKPATRKPTQKRSIQRVESILNAAMDCISEIGFSQLKMKDISTRANVSPSSVYQYFPDKQAILAALTKRCSEQMLSITESFDREVTNFDDLEQFLDISLKGHYDYLQEQAAIKFILANLAIDPNLSSHDEAINLVRTNALVNKLGRLLAKNETPEIEIFCYWLQHAIHCTVSFAQNKPEHDAHSILLTARKSLLSSVIAKAQ